MKTSKRKKCCEKCGRLNPLALAIALGSICGVYLFLLGVFSMFNIRFFWFSPELLTMLATIYPGYGPTLFGSFVGLISGIVCGTIGGFFIAWIHNITQEKCS